MGLIRKAAQAGRRAWPFIMIVLTGLTAWFVVTYATYRFRAFDESRTLATEVDRALEAAKQLYSRCPPGDSTSVRNEQCQQLANFDRGVDPSWFPVLLGPLHQYETAETILQDLTPCRTDGQWPERTLYDLLLNADQRASDPDSWRDEAPAPDRPCEERLAWPNVETWLDKIAQDCALLDEKVFAEELRSRLLSPPPTGEASSTTGVVTHSGRRDHPPLSSTDDRLTLSLLADTAISLLAPANLGADPHLRQVSVLLRIADPKKCFNTLAPSVNEGEIDGCQINCGLYYIRKNQPGTLTLAFIESLRVRYHQPSAGHDEAAPVAARYASSFLTIVAQQLDGKFLTTFLLTAFIALGGLGAIIFMLLFLGALRLYAPKTAAVFLVFPFGLPPFIAPLAAYALFDFNVLETALIWKIVLTLLCAALVSGISFDVGRRMLVLADDERQSYYVRGLQHFTISPVPDKAWPFGAIGAALTIAARQAAIDMADIVGSSRQADFGASGGLAAARRSEHFILRACEYRIIPYLSRRISFVLDSLILLGLLFQVNGTVSDNFTNMTANADVLQFIAGITVVLLLSMLLQFLSLFAQLRLFPR